MQTSVLTKQFWLWYVLVKVTLFFFSVLKEFLFNLSNAQHSFLASTYITLSEYLFVRLYRRSLDLVNCLQSKHCLWNRFATFPDPPFFIFFITHVPAACKQSTNVCKAPLVSDRISCLVCWSWACKTLHCKVARNVVTFSLSQVSISRPLPLHRCRLPFLSTFTCYLCREWHGWVTWFNTATVKWQRIEVR